MTDTRLTDAAREKIESFAGAHGPKLPPIPQCAFEASTLTSDVRASIERHTDAHGPPVRI